MACRFFYAFIFDRFAENRRRFQQKTEFCDNLNIFSPA